jgi:hypothetical protein
LAVVGLAAVPGLSQVTPTGPFTGTLQEGFENAPAFMFTQCVNTRVFSNNADLCTPGNSGAHVTSGWSFFCSIFPHGGVRLFGSAGGVAEYTFDTPAQRFGGYFGTNTNANDGVATFFDASNNVLATLPITAPANCSWTWNGWDAGSGPLIKRVQIAGNYSGGAGGFMMMDDMELDAGPATGVGTPICFGDGTLAPCPCGNSGQPGKGCDNSAATGGAVLTASGSTSPDTVVLSSSGELPTVSSVFLQGDQQIAPAVFGDGLRCAGGNLKRLYVKSAVGGVATAPQSGDPSITAQSAALGDPIAPGTSRFYQVYYRDPDLNFCPAPPGNSWNASSGLQITW